MPLNNIDYSKTIIYKIVCNDLNIKDVYIGHTTDFIRRKQTHRKNCSQESSYKYNTKLYSFIRDNGGFNNFQMLMIETFECKNGNEARTRERYWYEELKPNLNSRLPFITKQEYLENHRKQKREYDKKYREINREKILEAKRVWSKHKYEKKKQQQAEANI